MEIKITLDFTKVVEIGGKLLEAGYITRNELRFLRKLSSLQSKPAGGFSGNKMPPPNPPPRKIRFRGTRLDGGGVCEGSLISFRDGRMGIIPSRSAGYISRGFDKDTYGIQSAFYMIDPSTAAQYTGKVDKTGRKIFERDRVRLCYVENMSGREKLRDGTVVWDEGAFVVVWDDAQYGKSFLKHLEVYSIAVL